LGVHCSVRGGMMTALEEAKRLGCQTLQIFTHAPRQWRRPRIGEEEAAAFRARQKEYALDPLVVHTPYLPNLCTTNERLYLRSKEALKNDLVVCEKLGADYLVVHPGAYSEESTPAEGMERLSDAFHEALSGSGKTRVLLENMAGGGRRLGSQWSELKRMLEAARVPDRVGVCLDTAHAWGAGHAFSSAAEVDRTLDAIDETIDLARVYVIHANDSKAEHGSHRDLHQHIGQGKLGEKVFAALFADPRLQQCAVILETPKDDPSADLRNLATLRRLM
jgi:deoxyribonuclease IV